MRHPISAIFSRHVSGHPNEGSLCTITPLHLPTRAPLIGRALERANHALLARELSAVADAHCEGERIVLFDSPSQHALVGQLGENRSVYLAIDDRTVTVAGEDIPGEKDAERRLLAKVDHVICVSAPLAKTLRARVPERPDLPIDIVTNGYDEELFTPGAVYPEPAALATVSRPRILVVGHVSERIDWDGIAAFAVARPDIAWVFLGPVDPGMATQVATIAEESGATIRVLPPIAHDEVPAYIAHADVCAAPYRLNSFTLASSPLKVIEYLGAGAPALSTQVPALQPFSEALYWVREGDGQSYRASIEAALTEKRSPHIVSKRLNTVLSHTWSKKAKEIADLVCGSSTV